MHTRIRIQHPLRRGNLLVGCAIVLVLVIAALVGVGIWVANSWRGWAAGALTQTIDAALTEAQIDKGEQQEIMVHVEDLMDRFERGDVTMEQLVAVAESLGESPLIAAAIVSVADDTYIEGSELADDEKTEARLQLRRYAQGVGDGALDPGTIRSVVAPLEDPNPSDNSVRIKIGFDEQGNEREIVLKPSGEVTGEDLRTLTANAKKLADEAGVDEDPEPIDLSDEVKKAIDAALGTIGAASEPAPEPAPPPGP